jgi:hypothetical protein
MDIKTLKALREINELQRLEAKRAKAERIFDGNVRAYGSVESALRALDCGSRNEAVRVLMIAAAEVRWCPLTREWA